MGGEGAMMAANQSLKNNRSLASKRRENTALSGSYANIKLKEFPKATPEQLKAIKEKTIRENKKSQVLHIGIFILVCLALLIAIQYVF